MVKVDDDGHNGAVAWRPTDFNPSRPIRPAIARTTTSESMRDPKSTLTRKPTVSFGPENSRNSHYGGSNLARIPTAEEAVLDKDPSGCQSRRPTVFNPEDLRNPSLRRPTLTFTPDQLKYLQTRRPTIVRTSTQESLKSYRRGHSRQTTVSMNSGHPGDEEDEEIGDLNNSDNRRSALFFTPQQLKYLEARRPTMVRSATAEDVEALKGSDSRKSSTFGPHHSHSRSLHSRRPTVISLARRITTETSGDPASCKTRNPSVYPSEKLADSESRRPTVWSLHPDNKTDPGSWTSTVESLGLEKSASESRRQTVADLKETRHTESRQRKRLCIWMILTLLLLTVVAVVVPLAIVFTRTKAAVGITAGSTVLLPLYVYPDQDAWDPLFQAASTYQNLTFLVVVNPDSGPGSGKLPDNAYISSIQQLNTYPNIQTIGYVRTTLATRNISAVLADVAKYEGWAEDTSVTNSRNSLAVNGIFFDETPSTYSDAAAEYLSQINAYVKDSTKIKGAKTIIHNPGTIPDAQFHLNTTDIQVVVENTYASYNSQQSQKSISALPDNRSGYAFLVHSTPDNTPMQNLVDDISAQAKYIFVTDLADDYYASFGKTWSQFVYYMTR